MASIAVRAAVSAHNELQSQGLPFKLQQVQHFVAGALVGNGVKNFESFSKLRIPAAIDAEFAGSTDDSLCTWGRMLRLDVVDERVEKAMIRICGDEGRPLPEDPDLNAIKLRVSITVADHIRKHGLFVDPQKLLFIPTLAGVSMSVLKEMKRPDTDEQKFPPAAASSALANGLLPSLPARTLKDNLLYLGNQSMIGLGMPSALFAKWVEDNEPVMVEYPAPNIRVGRASRFDHYFVNNASSSAELGLGFFLATRKKQFDGQIAIVTPVLHHKSRSDDDVSRPWYAEFLKEQVHEKFMPHDDLKRLLAAMENKRSARLKVCPACAEIYSDSRAELTLGCNCARKR